MPKMPKVGKVEEQRILDPGYSRKRERKAEYGMMECWNEGDGTRRKGHGAREYREREKAEAITKARKLESTKKGRGA